MPSLEKIVSFIHLTSYPCRYHRPFEGLTQMKNVKLKLEVFR